MFRPEQHSRLQSLVFLFEKAFYFFVDDGHEPVMGTRPHPKCIDCKFLFCKTYQTEMLRFLIAVPNLLTFRAPANNS